LVSTSGKAKYLHPLCPVVRTWNIAELRLDELLPMTDSVEPKSTPKKKGKPMVIKKEASTTATSLP
jgi:hypothetical protein